MSWVERSAHKQDKRYIAMQQRSITTTFVSGQAQQIFLGFVLGLSDAVADSGIIWSCRQSSDRGEHFKRAVKRALWISGHQHPAVMQSDILHPNLLCNACMM
jgi:hypothetical protein